MIHNICLEAHEVHDMTAGADGLRTPQPGSIPAAVVEASRYFGGICDGYAVYSAGYGHLYYVVNSAGFGRMYIILLASAVCTYSVGFGHI